MPYFSRRSAKTSRRIKLMTDAIIPPHDLLAALFNEAVRAAYPSADKMPLPAAVAGKTLVIGAGKAAASMAEVVEKNWTGGDLEGVVVTRYAHGLDLAKIKVVEAGHPVPDEAGQGAAQEIFERVQNLGANDQVIILISGGGSSLLSLPTAGVSLESKKAINKALLKSGADISEMNTVRKKLSAIKGGRLAVAAYPAKIVTYMISDVPGDDPSVIASGPTVPDLTTVKDALRILGKYEIDLPKDAAAHLNSNAANPPSADHPAFDNCQNHMIAIPQDSLQAAAALARSHGIEPIILGDSIEGEAADVAKVFAGITRQVMDYDQPGKKPCVLLSGGETTVTVKSEGRPLGRGGRNAEFLLAFAQALGPSKNVYALVADTDGIDGTEDNAGAILDPDTWARADQLGLSLSDYLARHDAYNFFKALGDLVVTGPTRTNVNDFRAILILEN